MNLLDPMARDCSPGLGRCQKGRLPSGNARVRIGLRSGSQMKKFELAGSSWR
jgi:hypothetical protein